MKYIETYDAFRNELPDMKEIGYTQSGDNRFSYSETVYIHTNTGEIWIRVVATDDRGGRVFYERYDEEKEIIEIKNRCK